MKAYFTYKEILKKEDLIQYFATRYEVFGRGQLSGFILKNPSNLDIDVYDFRARHFGVFKVEGNKQTLIGGHRLILDTVMPSTGIIKEIVDENFDNSSSFEGNPEYPFYMIKLSKYKKNMMDYYKNIKLEGNSVIESSRFFVLRSERSMKLLEMFILSAITLAHNIYNNKYAITSCEKLFARLNSRFGFEYFPNTDVEDICGLEAYNLIISRDQIPVEYKEEIQKMETAYLMTDQICFTPEASKSYFAPDYCTPVYFRGIYANAA